MRQLSLVFTVLFYSLNLFAAHINSELLCGCSFVACPHHVFTLPGFSTEEMNIKPDDVQCGLGRDFMSSCCCIHSQTFQRKVNDVNIAGKSEIFCCFCCYNDLESYLPEKQAFYAYEESITQVQNQMYYSDCSFCCTLECASSETRGIKTDYYGVCGTGPIISSETIGWTCLFLSCVMNSMVDFILFCGRPVD